MRQFDHTHHSFAAMKLLFFQSYTKMPYIDSLVCCYIMKCCICNKSSLLFCFVCTGGNVTVWCGTGSTLFLPIFLISMFYCLICIFYILPYSCCFFVMFVYLRLIWTDRARAHLALPHQTSHHSHIVFTLN